MSTYPDTNFTPSSTCAELWQTLIRVNAVSGEMPATTEADSNVNQAWYIRVMLGFSGWLGALFLMGFIGIGFSFFHESMIAGISIGLALCTAAYVIFRLGSNNDFVLQLALALSMAGQGFVVFSLFQKNPQNHAAIFAAILLFEILLVAMMPNFIHRFLSTVSTVYAAYFLFQELGMFGFTSGIVAILLTALWWSPRRLRQPEVWRPIGFALALTLLTTEGSRLFSLLMLQNADAWWFKHGWRLAGTLVNLALLSTTMLVLRREGVRWSSLPALLAVSGTMILCGFGYVAPGLSHALLLILIAYSFGEKLLLGLGLLSLLSFLSHYYYQLQVSLLYKSIVLASLALLLLVVRWILNHRFPISTTPDTKEFNHA
ncbi:DUF4401 domain-containing protein [Undibacterium flavidum]|uniref:DUF4401 domain-containing protein n=1 Tax=Undibacterium flavidum TaxID=2762297 RepID=A0ABR6YC59_9BURK|nr:DUF4401 domain-containing protein [Undibacterium flavidum]MBC3874140.1 DUF4401 domain-containing protein [Undibacterium flavidum]